MNNTYALVLGQLASKLFTFGLNQALLRSVSPNALGVATYLEFLTQSVLFFSREAVRLAIQRTNNKCQLRADQSVVNFGFVPLLLSLPIAASLLWWNWSTETFQAELFTLDQSTSVLVVLGISILVELVVEPCYDLNQYHLNLARKARNESLGVLFRGLTTVACLTWIVPQAPVLAFALGQLAYSTIQLIGYITVKPAAGVSRVPKRLPDGWFDVNVVNVWKTLFLQMIFKQLLTEGDKLLINYFFPVSSQAVYAVMSNYGSIIARLAFQPVEESMRMWFTKQMSNGVSKAKVEAALATLEGVCVLYLNFIVLLYLAGYPNAGFLLRFVLSSAAAKWEATELFTQFGKYVLYIGLLAFNGIFEAIFTSVATTGQLRVYSFYMTASCVIFALVSKVAIENFSLGLSGLILANGVTMTMRIGWCGYHIRAFFIRQYGISVDIIAVIKYVGKFFVLLAVAEFLQFYLVGTFTANSFREVIIGAALCFGVLAVEVAWGYPRFRAYLQTKKKAD